MIASLETSPLPRTLPRYNFLAWHYGTPHSQSTQVHAYTTVRLTHQTPAGTA